MLNLQKRLDDVSKGEAGFTLIELSIVLVIIGLIVGGILTGQDLIKSAEQRATLAQIEKYNTAVNTFRNKFGGIPGDLAEATAASFGLTAITAGTAPCSSVGITGCGDGNGLLTDTNATNANAPIGEIVLFWRQLSDAGLIDGSFGADITVGSGQTTATSVGSDQPLAKLARSNYILVGSNNTTGANYFALIGLTAVTGGTSGTATYTGASYLNPIESYNMDKKVDDGQPNTGSVQARKGSILSTTVSTIANLVAGNASKWSSTTTPASGDCIYGGGAANNGTDVTDQYAVTTGNNAGTSPACSLTFKFN